MNPDFEEISIKLSITHSPKIIKSTLEYIWNQAVQACAESAECRTPNMTIVNKQSILKNLIS